MVCAHCGSSSAVSGRICSACGRFPETTGVTAATATMTPPPGQSDSETHLAPPTAAALGASDAETQLGTPIPTVPPPPER